MKLTARKVSIMEKDLAAKAIETQRNLSILVNGNTQFSHIQDLTAILAVSNEKIKSLMTELEKIHKVRFALRGKIAEFNETNDVNNLLLKIEESKLNMAVYNHFVGSRVLTSQALELELSRVAMFNNALNKENSNISAMMQTFSVTTMTEDTQNFFVKKQKEAKLALTALQDELAFINSSKTMVLTEEIVNELKELNQL